MADVAAAALWAAAVNPLPAIAKAVGTVAKRAFRRERPLSSQKHFLPKNHILPKNDGPHSPPPAGQPTIAASGPVRYLGRKRP